MSDSYSETLMELAQDLQITPSNLHHIITVLAWSADHLEEFNRLVNFQMEECDLNSIPTEACPGCGRMPGDGVTKDCWHPDGCGYFKEIEKRTTNDDKKA